MEVRVNVERLCEEVIPPGQVRDNSGLDEVGATKMDRSEHLRDTQDIKLTGSGDRLISREE